MAGRRQDNWSTRHSEIQRVKLLESQKQSQSQSQSAREPEIQRASKIIQNQDILSAGPPGHATTDKSVRTSGQMKY